MIQVDKHLHLNPSLVREVFYKESEKLIPVKWYQRPKWTKAYLIKLRYQDEGGWTWDFDTEKKAREWLAKLVKKISKGAT